MRGGNECARTWQAAVERWRMKEIKGAIYRLVTPSFVCFCGDCNDCLWNSRYESRQSAEAAGKNFSVELKGSQGWCVANI
jgi:hypothetical protein